MLKILCAAFGSDDALEYSCSALSDADLLRRYKLDFWDGLID